MKNKKSSSIDGMTSNGIPVEQIPSFTSIPPETVKAVKIEYPAAGSDGTATPMVGSHQIHSPAPKQYGWECPKCGAVMSPDQKTCPFCAPPFTIKTYY